MSMDSAMDSLSTTSEHSVASSNDSVHNMRHNDSGHHSSRPNSHDKTRTPTPSSPQPLTARDLRHFRDGHSPLTSGAPQMLPMPHPLSPPQVSTPSGMVSMQSRMAQSFSHLPPHGLGLLNSFMHHASPLDLMAAAHHHGPPRSYNSPPPISSSDPTANECKLVDYRGQKVAAFIIQGDTMLCLPQAFELFLKHLVGGLHTVYTKLKRLDIVPLVCNVEQVRILRGLGAIQPGVNRCKLLGVKEFDVLYKDCTTARPGRPPKRGPVGLSLPASSHLNSNHPQLKKHRLDNGDYPYENGHMSDLSRLDKSPLLANGYNAPPTHLNHMPFMQMGHHGAPLMSPGMPPHGLPRPDAVAMLKNQNIPGMDAITRSGIWENCRAAYEDIVKHLERLRDERVEERGGGSASGSNEMEGKMRSQSPRGVSPNGHSPILNLSKVGDEREGNDSHGAPSERSDAHSPNPSIRDDDDDNISNVSEIEEHNDKDDDDDISDTERPTTSPPPASNAELDSRQQALNFSTLAAASVPNGQDPSLSSTETLLRNIQGLLKVAADNARQQERQITFEKAELKMDVLREREVKDSLERQLTEEQKLRVLFQKRYKRERKLRSKLQDQMENEFKKRNQIEEILKASGAPAEAIRILAENNNTTMNNNNNASMEHESSSSSVKDRDRVHGNDSEKDRIRNDKKYDEHKINSASPKRPRSRDEREKNWNYPPGLDNIMATGAFWQNYSESLAQEMEMERKNRQASENDVKGSLQERSNYYKNSTLYAT